MAQKAVVMKVQHLCVVVCVPWGQPSRGPEQMPFLRLTFGPALLLLSKVITASPRAHPAIGGPLPNTRGQGHPRPLWRSLPHADVDTFSPKVLWD